MPAVPEDHRERQRREQVECRQEVRAEARRRQRAVAHRFGFRFEPFRLEALCTEALHRADTADGLRDDAGEIAQLLLLFHADRRETAREPRRDDVEQR